jgi:hypothetical protein
MRSATPRLTPGEFRRPAVIRKEVASSVWRSSRLDLIRTLLREICVNQLGIVVDSYAIKATDAPVTS